jgi:predicted exporter
MDLLALTSLVCLEVVLGTAICLLSWLAEVAAVCLGFEFETFFSICFLDHRVAIRKP